MRGLARLSTCLAVLLLAPSVHAAPPSARAILERYVDVTGGRAALDADTALRWQGRITDAGMHGTFEAWTHAPDRVLRVERVGTLRTKEGLDGTRAWRTDFTAKK